MEHTVSVGEYYESYTGTPEEIARLIQLTQLTPVSIDHRSLTTMGKGIGDKASISRNEHDELLSTY